MQLAGSKSPPFSCASVGASLKGLPLQSVLFLLTEYESDLASSTLYVHLPSNRSLVPLAYSVVNRALLESRAGGSGNRAMADVATVGSLPSSLSFDGIFRRVAWAGQCLSRIGRSLAWRLVVEEWTPADVR